MLYPSELPGLIAWWGNSEGRSNGANYSPSRLERHFSRRISAIAPLSQDTMNTLPFLTGAETQLFPTSQKDDCHANRFHQRTR